MKKVFQFAKVNYILCISYCQTVQKCNRKLSKSGLINNVVFLVCLFIILNPFTAITSQPKANGSLSFIEKVPILKVWGTPKEQGFAQGYLLGDRIISMINGFFNTNPIGINKDKYQSVFLTGIGRMKIEPDYEEELKAILRGIKAATGNNTYVPFFERDLTYMDLVAINCLYDIFRSGCSSVSAWGNMTNDGSPLIGRNFDWYNIPAMYENQIIVIRIHAKESKRLDFVSISWPGMIGCVTGMNEKGIALTCHDSKGLTPTIKTGFYPYMLTFRSVIETTSPGSAIQNVENILKSRVTGIGKNLMITIPSGSDGPAAVVFELDGNLRKENGYTKRLPYESNSYLICTNHFRKRKEPSGNCERYSLLNNQLKSIEGNKNQKRVTKELIWELLRKVIIPGLVTHHSVVFEPDKKLMHFAIAKTDKDAPFCKAITLNISDLLKSETGQKDSNDEVVITKIIHDSFGWALTKDRALFESIFAKDEDFFTFYPDSKSTVVGWSQFQKFLDNWMDPRNRAIRFDIRNLRIVISKTGHVAWFSAFVDDEGEWDGKPWGAKDIRWTGVLEKRKGKWVIVQQHMSAAIDKVLEAAKQSVVKDFDGNIYKMIKIGNQIWMAENLKVTHYRDGTPIPNVPDSDKWSKLKTGALCWMEDDPIRYKDLYGTIREPW